MFYEISLKKVLFTLLLVVGIGSLAYYSSRPKYLIVYLESSLEEYTDSIPEVDEDIIVYQVMPGGNLMVVGQ
jgi:hypothetical protein